MENTTIINIDEVIDNNFDDSLGLIGDFIDNDDLEFLSNMLKMEDDTVRLRGFTFLDSLEKNLSDENTEIMLAQFIKHESIDIDKINTLLIELHKEIEDSELSEVKKNFLSGFMDIFFGKLVEVGTEGEKIVVPAEFAEGVIHPKYAHDTDGAMDVYAMEDYTIHPGETRIIPTGIKMAIPRGYGVLVQPRSGKSLKSKLRIANSPGLIDAGYRDDIGVIIENIEPPIKDITYDFNDKGEIIIKSILHGQDEFIAKGERFAQLRLVKIPQASLFEVESVRDYGEDRKGGFGSSGEF